MTTTPPLTSPAFQRWNEEGVRIPGEQPAQAEPRMPDAAQAWQAALALAQRANAPAAQLPAAVAALAQRIDPSDSMLRPLGQPFAVLASQAVLAQGAGSTQGPVPQTSAGMVPDARSNGGPVSRSGAGAGPATDAPDQLTSAGAARQGQRTGFAAMYQASAAASQAGANLVEPIAGWVAMALARDVIPVTTMDDLHPGLIVMSAAGAAGRPPGGGVELEEVAEHASPPTDQTSAAPGSQRNVSTAEEALRIYAEWTTQGLSVWVGAYTAQQPALNGLVPLLRRWLAERGERLCAVVCNGETIFDAADPAALGGAAPQPGAVQAATQAISDPYHFQEVS